MITSDAESEMNAIRQVVSDYYGGWYEADVERIARSLHPDLVKRTIRKDAAGHESLITLTRERMLEKTRQGGGSDVAPSRRHYDLAFEGCYQEIASVHVVADEYVEYLQLAQQDGRWRIVNVLWTENRANG